MTSDRPGAKPETAEAGGIGASRLLRQFSTIMAARVAGAVLGLLGQVLLARSLGADALGVFYLALSVAATLAVICGLGFPSVTVRFVAQYRNEELPGHLTAFIRSIRTTPGLALAVAAALLVGVTFWLPGLSDGDRIALLLGLVTAPALLWLRVNGAIANAYRRFPTSFFPDLLGRPIVILVVVAILAAGLVGTTATNALALHVVGVTLLALWQYAATETMVRTDLADMSSKADGGKPVMTTRTWLGHSLPMVPIALFTALFADLCIVFAAPFLEKSDLAVFGVCLKIALLVGFATQLIHQVILPDAADAVGREDRDEVYRLMGRANGVAVLFCAVAVAGFIALGPYLLGVFGEGFAAGATCLVAIAVGQLVRAAMGPASQILMLSGFERSTIPISALSLAILAGTIAFGASQFGVVGAGIAVALSTMFWTAGLAWLALRKTGIWTALVPATGITPSR